MTGPVISAKVMILGAVGVGKTSLVKRLVHDRFEADYKTTIGVDIQTCDVKIDGGAQTVRLMLWDTDGDFGQRIFETAYIKGASAAIIVADASRPATIEKLKGLIEAFSKHLAGRPVRAVVSKCDLVDSLPDVTGSGLVDAEILFASAKSGEGVRDIFISVAADIARRRRA